MKTKCLFLEIPRDLWNYIEASASDRSHYKNYTTEEMIQCKPQQDQVLKWLEEIRQNKLRYKR